MALTESIEYDKIEIVTEYRHVQVRKATVIKKDGVELTRSFERYVLNCGTLDSSDNLVDNPLSKDDQTKNALPPDEKALLDRCSGEVMLFRLKGPLSFGAAKGISERMMIVRNYKVLILDITDVPRLGVTATLAIEDMMQEAKNNSRKAFVAGANEKVKDRLAKFGVEGIIETRKKALESALKEIT